jgi:hypothetical protein
MIRSCTFSLPLTVSLAMALASAGCLSDLELDEDVDVFRIINGSGASSDVPKYAATVAVHRRWESNSVSASPFCSGTLISPDTVLTAAHCCDAAQGGPNYKTRNPDEVSVYFGEGPAFEDGAVNGLFIDVSEVVIYPGYDRWSLVHDLCLLRLASTNHGAPSIPPLPASLGLSDADEPSADNPGKMLDFVGFGYSDLAKTQYGVKLQTYNAFAGLGCVVPGCPSGRGHTEFSYVQDGDPYFGTCNGDSGGPAFIKRDGETYVAGITSYGDSQCKLYGVSTNVSAYEAFIDAFIDASLAEGSTCGNGECEPGESCDGRHGTTACPADCDGVTKGRPTERYCEVGGTCVGPGCP